MVVDFKADPGHARGFDVLDAATGERLRVFYADEATGVCREYLRDGRGQVFTRPGPDGEPEIAWREFVRGIRIVPRGPRT
jgi:hypothetical protein